MGDSESQVILPRIGRNIFFLLEQLAKGEVIHESLPIHGETCLTITLAAGEKRKLGDASIPNTTDWPYKNSGAGVEIRFFPRLMTKNTSVSWACVETSNEGKLLTRYGRVAHVTALAKTLRDARRHVYASIESVTFSGKRWRDDIGT